MIRERHTRGLWPLLWMALLGFILYGQTIPYDYTYLDDHDIVRGQMEKLGRISTISRAFTEDVFHKPGEKAFYYRPMLTISFALDAMAGRGQFFWFHIGNILLHVLASWLLFLLLVGMDYDRMKSFLFSLVFLVHPVLVHAVAWVPGRNDSLLAVFLFPSILFLVRYLGTLRTRELLFHFFFFILALLSKETAIAIPAVASAFIILIYKKFNRNVAFLAGGWIVISLIWLGVRYNTLGGSHGFPLLESVASILRNLKALVPFLGKSIIPAGLSVFPILKDMKIPFIAGFAALGLLVVLFFTSRGKHWGYSLFAMTWFLLFLIPSFIKSTTQEPDFTEHRVYVSLAGLILFFLETGIVQNTDWRKKAFFIPLMLILAVLSVLTLRHSQNYQNGVAFWGNAVRTSPSLAFNYNNLGAMYFMENNLPEAEKYFRKALQINPKEPIANGNLGLVCMNTNRRSEAETFYLREIEINPTYDNVYYNLGILYYTNNRIEQATKPWEILLTINPSYAGAYHNLIVAYTDLHRPMDADRIRALAASQGIDLSGK